MTANRAKTASSGSSLRPAPSEAPVASAAPFIEARQVGLLTLEQRRTITRLWGAEVLRRAAESLPSDRRQEFEDISLFSPCRCRTMNMVLQGVADALGREVDGVAREVVRASFGTVIRTVWKLLTRFDSEEAMVQRASMLYARAIDRGSAHAYVKSPGHLVMEISDRPDLTHIDIVSIGAAIEAGFDMSGRRVRVTHFPIPDGVRYEGLVQARHVRDSA